LTAQPVEIFELINRNGLSLTTQQDTFFASTEFDTTYKGYEGLRMLQPSIEYLSDVFIDIQELGGYHEFYMTNVSYHADFVTWVGKSYDNPVNGHLILVQNGEYFGGLIMENDEVWELFANGDSLMLALKRDRDHDKHKIFGIDEYGEPLDEELIPDPCQIPPDDCYAEIRLALEITPEADEYIEQFTGTISGPYLELVKLIFYLCLEAQVNIAFKNSAVMNKVLRIGIVDDFIFDYNYSFFPQLGEMRANIGIDIGDLLSSGHLHNDLSDYRCDIAVMMTDQDYPFYAGIVNAIGPEVPGFCSIVEIKYASGQLLTFAHEIGHLFGARHQREYDDPDFDENCNHAWAIPKTGSVTEYHTIVGVDDSGDNNHILNYSNPFVKVAGSRTGTGIDYNAASIDNNGCFIADYQPDPYWNIHIVGPDTLCLIEEDDILFYAEVHEAAVAYPGHPPYTYIWQWGYVWNDTNFPELDWLSESNDGNYLIVPYEPDEDRKEMFVRLVVVSDDKEILKTVKHIKLFPFGCEIATPIGWEPRTTTLIDTDDDNCNVTPLISFKGDKVEVHTFGNNVGKVFYTCYDVQGRSISSGSYQSDEQPSVEFEFRPSSGIYFISIETLCGMITYKAYKP